MRDTVCKLKQGSALLESRAASTPVATFLALDLNSSLTMAVDWIGFGYAAAIALGGFMGYKRKGSVMSLMAGLVFGGLSAYGALNVSNDPRDIKVSLLASGLLSIVMGVRYKKSRKLMPAGIICGLSLLMVFQLLLHVGV